MDERQQQIKAGAGLEDSRINQDLVDFLQKWGSWILMALAVAALIYAGMQWLERQRVAKVNEAFAALEGAGGGANPNPDALRRVADEYEGVESVAELARIKSADVLLDSVRMGIRSGAQINNDGSVGQIDPDGNVNSEGELLSDEERSRFLDQAQSLYASVLDATRGKEGKQTLAINAAFGLAAVYETKGEADRAREQLDLVVELAEQAGFPAIARLARSRTESLTTEAPGPLLARADLPELPAPPEPEPAPDLMPDPEEAAPAPVDPDAGEPAESDDAGEGSPPAGDDAAPPADDPDQP